MAMSDPVVSQVLLGTLVAYVLQWLKKAPWFPILTERSTAAWKFTLSCLVAVMSAMGLGYTFDPVAGTILITGVSAASLWNAIVAFGVSLLSQHGAYEMLINKPTLEK